MIDRLNKFISDARGGATAIAAGAIAAMTVAGTALIVEHAWLVDQRDVLKTASDAAAVAATIEMQRQVGADPTIDDATLSERLDEIAERYVLLNLEYLPEGRRARAQETLTVDVEANRNAGTVDVNVSADLGGTLFAGKIPLLGGFDVPDRTRTRAGVESARVPVEVVLAIDISGSMVRGLDGSYPVPDSQTRMALVKEASRALVDALDPSSEHRAALGLVPWHRVVRLGPSDRDRWTRFQWAEYPSRRYYGHPYLKTFAYLPAPDPVTHGLPLDPPEVWLGCLDDHRIASGGTAAPLSLANLSTPPTSEPFAQYFFPALRSYAHDCASDPLPTNYHLQYCYTQARTRQRRRQIRRPPQHGCDEAVTQMQSLTSNRAVIEASIDELHPIGDATYSTLGVSWAHRMLMPEWKRIWGGNTHPLELGESTNEGLRKAIVLLTDGHDNLCGSPPNTCADSPLGMDRAQACDAAKAAGTEIFVVAAMPPAEVTSQLGNSLRNCSSEADFPDGTYVFINNETHDELRGAFLSIANQLTGVRKTY